MWHQVGQFECIKHDLVAAVDEDNPVFYARRNQQSNFVAWQEDDPNKARLQRAPQLFDGTNAATDRSTIPRPDTPYKCGVVWFYHIPCTGGNSINRWFREYKSPQYGNISYYQGWALETLRDGTFCKNPQRVEDNFAKGMLNHVQNLGPTEWRIAHSHLVDFYLNESEDLLNLWRSEVEAQNCEFISSIMIRDPLNHALSLHKIVKSKNSTQEKWAKHLERVQQSKAFGQRFLIFSSTIIREIGRGRTIREILEGEIPSTCRKKRRCQGRWNCLPGILTS